MGGSFLYSHPDARFTRVDPPHKGEGEERALKYDSPTTRSRSREEGLGKESEPTFIAILFLPDFIMLQSGGAKRALPVCSCAGI